MKKVITLLCVVTFMSGVWAQKTVRKAEYFFDNDPGFDKASKISVPANSGTITIDFYAAINSLSAGLHTFCVRTANDSGWSITNSLVMLKQIPQQAKPSLVKGEYFFDSDPGFGKAKGSFSLPLSTKDSLVNITAIADALSEGLYVLYLRALDGDSQWSITNNWLFFKQVSANKPNLVKTEYFFDSDPGFGLANTIPLSASINIIDQDALLNTTGLDSGFHYFFLRTYDANGNWSITNRDTFTYRGKGSLPVSWLSFTAEQKENNGLLTWQTANEINTSYFEIQHSTDAVNWIVTGTVKATVHAQNNYSFNYANLKSGSNFFRLKQVDVNGKYTYSVVRNVYYISLDKRPIKVTPNPVTSGKIWLSGDVFTKSKTTVTIIGSNGIHYQQQKFDIQTGNTISIYLNKYISSGLYFIEIESAIGKQTTSFIVN